MPRRTQFITTNHHLDLKETGRQDVASANYKSLSSIISWPKILLLYLNDIYVFFNYQFFLEHSLDFMDNHMRHKARLPPSF